VSCKDIYLRSGTFVIVKDSSGNIIAQYFNNRNKCLKIFLTELVTVHGVSVQDLNNVQIYIDGKRVC
jgi:hypothetical protein